MRAAATAGEIDVGRVESYLKLRDEQEFQRRQQDVRAQLESKRQARIASKAANKRIKDKGR